VSVIEVISVETGDHYRRRFLPTCIRWCS